MKLCDAELGGCKLLLDSKKIIKGHFEKQDNYFVQVVKDVKLNNQVSSM